MAPTTPKTRSGLKVWLETICPARGELDEADDGGERGALDELHQEANRRRQRDAERLRQDDVAHARDIAAAERLRGLGLAARHAPGSRRARFRPGTRWHGA